MKAIILAGGAGTRLYPLTQIVCKQLLPIYDKPMIYYPLSTLMLGGLQEVLIISTPKDLPAIRNLLGDGSRLGMRIEYAEQAKPNGIAQAFVIGADFIGADAVTLILGDNIFYGPLDFFREALRIQTGACVFGYKVRDPERYGVVEFDAEGRVLSLEEKPNAPKSSYAVPGLYVYDNQVVEISRALKPSARGEYEITDVNLEYLRRGQLNVRLLGRGMAWLDTGTPGSLIEASNYIAAIENRQGLKVACLEEIAYGNGFIDRAGLESVVAGLRSSDYREYLQAVLQEPPLSQTAYRTRV
ncbi:MAG TPA: glucose-1-phosphate thymidylyltransferase RfbA [Chthoniobacteraceae bacterium]|jgi:glucose-1-phosphate thymidylyltransferase|nr:glucose-1-phosphate thymidylyltransferase RfbA [Chthoniobacteraceae bacterium]